MKEALRELLAVGRDPLAGRNFAREVLQAQILAALQRSGAMIPLAFQGGTALRILYRLPRFSEDLDFALERTEPGFDFARSLRTVQSDLQRQGYQVEVTANERKTVHAALVRFPGLLHDLGLSPHPTEILAVRVEIDTRPPAGAVLETTVVRRHTLLHLQHHDRASLLAGKLHAILARPYLKGRDLYDLIWYLSDSSWPAPNLALLNAALAQTGWTGPELTPGTWPSAVRERLAGADWKRAVADVAPFLENPAEAALVSEENLLRLLENSA